MRANTQGGKRKERLGGTEFVRRFLLHVLPTGIKRIRHYGGVRFYLQGTQAAGSTSGAAHLSGGVCAAVQSNMVYLPQELLLVSSRLASRLINANRFLRQC